MTAAGRDRPGRAFARLWVGQSVSEVGSQVTLLALPLLAIKTLRAGPVAIGLLSACETVPFLLIGLPAGAWLDRRRRRPALVWSDLVRVIALGSIPVAAAAGALTMAHVVAVALIGGTCAVVFDIGQQAYLPSIVPTTGLLAANARLETTRSAAQVVGPALAGALVQAVGAPAAIAVDAGSFAWSAVWVASAGDADEDLGEPADEQATLRRAIAAGVRFVRTHDQLRPLATYTACYNLFSAMGMAVFLLYAVRSLHLSSGVIGLLFSLGSLGFVGGALSATAVCRRLGTGPTLVATGFVQGVAFVLVPLAPQRAPLPLIITAMALETFANSIFVIASSGLRQTITPPALLGRMTATFRFAVRGTLPVGSVAGGLFGAALGLRPTLWVSAAGGAVAAALLLAGPLRRASVGSGADSDGDRLAVPGEPPLERGRGDGPAEEVPLGDVAPEH